MKVTQIYFGERVSDYLIQDAICFMEYWDYLVQAPGAMLRDINLEGFDKTGVKEEVSFIGHKYVIISVYLD